MFGGRTADKASADRGRLCARAFLASRRICALERPSASMRKSFRRRGGRCSAERSECRQFQCLEVRGKGIVRRSLARQSPAGDWDSRRREARHRILKCHIPSISRMVRQRGTGCPWWCGCMPRCPRQLPLSSAEGWRDIAIRRCRGCGWFCQRLGLQSTASKAVGAPTAFRRGRPKPPLCRHGLQAGVRSSMLPNSPRTRDVG